MENKLLKVIAVMEDGTQKEFEGAGIVAYAITDGDDQTSAHGGVIGKFNDNSISALMHCLEETFKDRWMHVSLMRRLEGIFGIKDGEEHMETIEKAAEEN